jgi:hypothetical protein
MKMQSYISTKSKDDYASFTEHTGVPLNRKLSELDDSNHVNERRVHGIYRAREEHHRLTVHSDADTEEMTDKEE